MKSEPSIHRSLDPVKIRFPLDPSDWHGSAWETLWAKPKYDLRRGIYTYVILNSPFFTLDISFMDRVTARSEDEALVFNEVCERSGNSTYMILINDEGDRYLKFWNILEVLGCTYESSWEFPGRGGRRLLSVNVPKGSDIFAVYRALESAAAEGVWDFQEGFVGHNIG